MTNKKVTTTKEQPNAGLVYDASKFKTKSEAIRFYSAQGHSRAEIARAMNILYQHVRNVLTQPIKKGQ